MADSLKQKTITGVSWSFVEQILTRGANFVIGIILARLLSPTDYGLVGLIAVFLSISQMFVDGGLSVALIREKSASEKDLSTVYIFNLTVSVVLYSLLFFTAPLVSSFYDQPILSPLLRVLSLTLVIGSFTAVHNTLLTIRVDFKTKSIISFATALLSGAAGIFCALKGLGVWSLIAQSVGAAVVSTMLLLLLVRWRPKMVFSGESFRRLFGYSFKLVIADLVIRLYDNAYPLVIGKRFSAASVGQFTQAQKYPGVVNSTFTSALNRVAFPILSQLQDDDERLLSVYEKYIKLSCFIIFPVMLGLCGCSRPFVSLLLTDKWLDCVPLMQIMCFSLLLDGVTNINLNLLYVKGRSDLVLRMELIKKGIAFAILFGSMFFGLKVMCLGLVLNAYTGFCINTIFTKKVLNYGLLPQLKAMIPYLLCAFVVLAESLLFSHFIQTSWLSLLVSVTVCPVSYWLLAKIARLYAYTEVKDLIKSKLH